jgi:putative oxidoreductase
MKLHRYPYLELSSRPIARWAPIPLRLIVGYGFLEHGVAKLSKGPDAFAAILHAMGVPDPHLMAWFTILTELLGGFAVILGAFVAIVSVPMAVVLLVAMFKVHLPYGFSSIKLIAETAAGAKFGPPGYEVNLLYLACLAALVIGGCGPFALDRLMGENEETPSRGSLLGHPMRVLTEMVFCRTSDKKISRMIK